MTQSSTDVSPSSAAADSQIAGSLALLTAEQRQRLTEVLDRYLSALEQDIPIAQDALVAEHPDLADALRSYFRSLEDLHNMAAGFGGAVAGALPPESHHDSAKRIGDFELIREIGRGGMGVVYEARQISLNRRVAVKLLPFAAVLDAKQIARFKHEAQAAAHLHHPNIVPVFAIGVERGVHFYAMQYIDGQPLDRAIGELRTRVRGSGFRVQEGRGGRESGVGSREQSAAAATVEYSALSTEHDGRRSAVGPQRRAAAESPASRLVKKDNRSYFRRVAELGIQAAEALHAAHEYGVVHRDIKPSNLLLAADGKLWITDFGLARFQHDASLTRTGDLVGTMRYMSPEQAAGQSALVDHRTDIYSLGVTLYELTCLQPAFPEDRGPALLRQIDSVDPPRPRHVRPDIPADLETVILKAMARDREERYTTAQQLSDDLTCVLDGKATLARPPTAVDRVGRWARRHRRIVIASVIGLVVAILGLSTSTLLIAIQTQRAKAAAQSADRRYLVAREMLDRLGMQIAEQLVDVPGADVVRQQLLDETRRYYLSFIEETQADPVLRVDAALAYGKIGGLLELLGSAEESLAAHRQSAKILSELAAANSHEFATERQLGQAENNVALALRRVGKTPEAKLQFEQALRRQEKLLARQPQDFALEAELALTLGNFGLLQHEAQQPGPAQSSLQAAIDHFQPALAQSPEDVHIQQKLAGAYNNLAATHLDSRPADAARLHGQALELLRAAVRASPGNLALRRDVGSTLNNLGAALAHAQQPAAAQAAYEQAIEIREELVRLAATRTSYRTDLAVSLNNLGMLENRSGQTEEAQAKFRRAVELYESLTAQFPSDSTIHSNLGSVYNNLGVSLERTEQLEPAATAFASAVTHQRAALEIAPDLARCRELLLKHLESQGRVLNKLGRAAEAAQATQAIERLTAFPSSTHRQP